jgi:hypothetical protein
MADQEFLEPEEIASSFNPLDASVNEKSYTRPNVTLDASEINTPIPEPIFTPPPIEKKEEKREKKPIEPFNENLNDLPNKEKAVASEQMATMIIQGYELLCTLAEKTLMFNEKKIRKLEMEGAIDTNLPIPIGVNQQITFREFIDEYNTNAEGTLAVTDDFKNEVRPVLIRILQKKGIGLTDEQYLLMLLTKDIITKGAQFFSLRTSMNQMIEMLKTHTEEYRSARLNNYAPPSASASAAPPPPPPSSPSPAPVTNYQPQEPEYVPTEVIDNYDFEDDEEDDMPEWAKAAPSANDIVNEMTNPEGLGMPKRKKSPKRIK